MQNLTNYLHTITGLTFNTSLTDMLDYKKDENENAIIAKDNQGNNLGSSTARDYMTEIIGKSDIIDAGIILNIKAKVLREEEIVYGKSPHK